MSKRRLEEEASNNDEAMDKDQDEDEDEDEDEDMKEIVNVDFEFFDPQPQDFLAIKRLAGQLFDADAEVFYLSDLTDLILSQPLLGSTVKVDGHESDPYAFLTILNMNVHKMHKSISALTEYFLSATKLDSQFNSVLKELLHKDTQGSDLGLVLTERLVNMPVQVMPPMYRMLTEEIDWANEDNEPYQFKWFLLVSKVYKATAATAEVDDSLSTKKKKTTRTDHKSFYFHPEDEFIEKHATYSLEYKYLKEKEHSSDARASFDDFGIIPGGKVMLISKENMIKVIEQLEQVCS